jgi:hypothetical protein
MRAKRPGTKKPSEIAVVHKEIGEGNLQITEVKNQSQKEIF